MYSATPVERWLEDSEFVYGARLASFDLPAYLDRTAPQLSPYAEYISHWCGHYSISPMVLLSIMEMRSSLLSAATPDLNDPFAGLVPGATMQEQVINALNGLAQDFYAYRAVVPAPAATEINAGTYALLNLLRGDVTPETFAESAAPIKAALLDTMARLVPDVATSRGDEPTIAAVPPTNLLQFPWKNGVARWFNGVHTTSGTDPGTMSSIDFRIHGQPWGADTSTDYVVAAHSGVVTKFSSCNVRVTSPTGWQTNYYHLDGVIVTTGQVVAANQTLGVYANNLAQATCTGGNATQPHVHFSLLKDGIYNSLDGVTINGYLVHPGRYSYDFDPGYMWLEKNGVKHFVNPPVALASTPSLMPNLSLNDVSVVEGDAGTKAATFTLTLSAPATGEIRVTYQTEDITAHSGSHSSSSAITIPGMGTATPYPSTITVPATLGTLTKVTVTLDGFAHTYPSDVDIMLVGPTGKYVVLMNRKGSSLAVENLTITLDDSASTELPTSLLSSGSYRVQSSHDAFLPGPAPPITVYNNLAGFAGTNPSGIWMLYVYDRISGDAGSLSRGWRLSLTTVPPSADYVPTAGTVTFPNGATTLPLPVTINGDAMVEAAETFRVTLLTADLANITDGIGVGTILNDDHTTFTDSALTAGLNAIKLVHVNELRNAINAARAGRTLSAFAWTDPVLTAGVNVIRAVHVAELRTALAEVYTAAGLTPPSYTDASLAGVMIKTLHITELRNALLAVE